MNTLWMPISISIAGLWMAWAIYVVLTYAVNTIHRAHNDWVLSRSVNCDDPERNE